MADENSSSRQIVQFLKQKDYEFVKELGQGACGKTVVIRDAEMDELFVCKKYRPISETLRDELFTNFKREIKLLHQVYHQNLVRVFNYFIYDSAKAGYILMEYIRGTTIDEYVKHSPQSIELLFSQSIAGFAHLEDCKVLHRDIRPANLMVRDDGILKIIDFGFGKRIDQSEDFDKSISLNWWCELPNEFQDKKYTFATEVYFIGKLFQKLIMDAEIESFRHRETLAKMCEPDPSRRLASFAAVARTLKDDVDVDVKFSDHEKSAYRQFTSEIVGACANIESGTKYITDPLVLLSKLEDVYRSSMLEEVVQSSQFVIRCLLADGTFRFYRNRLVQVESLRAFISLLKGSGRERQQIILANLHKSLDVIERIPIDQKPDDDIPF